MNLITKMKVTILKQSISESTEILQNNQFSNDELTELLKYIKLTERLSGYNEKLETIYQLIDQYITNEFVLK